jgi:hypothetical protein
VLHADSCFSWGGSWTAHYFTADMRIAGFWYPLLQLVMPLLARYVERRYYRSTTFVKSHCSGAAAAP